MQRIILRFLSVNIALIFLLLSASCSPREKKSNDEFGYNLFPSWSMTDSLVSSESVIYDELNHQFYVTSSQEYAFTGKGYVSRLSEEGKLLEAEWVTGLNRPTGMALRDGLLYIGDMDALVVVDIADGMVKRKYKAQSEIFPGINDVSITLEGNVFVTASAINAIFTLENENLELWLQDSVELQWANGISAKEDRLIIAGKYLSSIDYTSKEILRLIESDDVTDLDGLESDGLGGFIVSSAGPGVNTIWHVDGNGKSKVLVKGVNYNADFDYLPKKKLVVAAGGNHEKREYGVYAYDIKKAKDP